MKKKASQMPTLAEVEDLRADIEARTAHVLNGKRMQQSELLREVIAFYPTFNETKLRYLRDRVQYIPSRKSDNNYYYYVAQDLRDILLALALAAEHGAWRISYSQIFGILRQSVHSQLQEVRRAAESIEVPVALSHLERGLYIWRSNLVRYLLIHLFDGQPPPETYVFLYKPRHSILEREEKHAPWLRVKSFQFSRLTRPLSDRSLILTTSYNGNVIHPPSRNVDYPQWYERGATWYHIEGGGRKDPSDYDLILAVPDDRRPCRQPENAIINLLLRLLDGCFLDAADIEHANQQALTELDVVTGLIPKMSPAWHYCACFAPDARTPGRLVIRSASKHFPSEGRRSVQVGIGQLLSGRAYSETYPVVVARAIEDGDPRIAEDRPTSAAAVPTLYYGHANGALYVATRKAPAEAPTETSAFSEDDVALLRILGLIAGQLLGHDQALEQSGEMSLAITDEPAPAGRPWEALRPRLAELLATAKAPSTAVHSKDSIHLVAVQVNDYDALEAVSPEVAAWAVAQLYTSAVHYFADQVIPLPEVYTHSPREFLLLLPHIDSSDETDREMRDLLRAHLNTLSLSLPGKGQQAVACDLWSLPFRYAELARPDGDAEKLVDYMVAQAKQAFIFLPYVYRAHQHERSGAWHMALDQYRLAYRRTPDNLYLLRHMAKAQTQLGHYQEAINRWRQMLAEKKHPSYYRRLAQNLVALGTEESVIEARKEIDNAIAMDEHSAKSHAVAGSIYAIAGEPDLAIAELELAAAYDPTHAARYLLHVAGIHYDQGRYDEALDTCIMAQTHDPDDRDVPAMMMRAAWAMNRGAPLSP